jgi:hypothetical protein
MSPEARGWSQQSKIANRLNKLSRPPETDAGPYHWISSAPRALRIYVSLVGKCFCGAIEIAIFGSFAKEMAMILNCLAGGANARFLQSAQRNLRGTAGHSQEGPAQGSNRNKQDNTIKQQFGRSPLSDRRSNTRTPTNIRIKRWRGSRLDKRANRRASSEATTMIETPGD